MPDELVKQAVLISHPDDLVFLKAQFDASATRFIAHEFHTIQKLPNEKLEYFFAPSQLGLNQEEEIQFLAANWFRNEQGVDLMAKDGVSPGPIITRGIVSRFANVYKNYVALKSWIDKVDVLHASTNQSPSFLRAAGSFGDKIKWYTPPLTNSIFESSTPERYVFCDYPSIHRYSQWMRLVQSPVLPIARRHKILYFTDWSSRKVAKKSRGFLHVNGILPWQSAYYKLTAKELHYAKTLLPDKIPAELLNSDRLAEILKRHKAVWDNALITMFADVINETYNTARPLFVRTLAVYHELFCHYQPSLIILPGETHFAYVMAAQVAKSLGVKILLAIDGYATMSDPSVYYRDAGGNDFLFTHVAAFGRANEQHLIRSGIPKEMHVRMKAPIFYNYTALTPEEKCYDALIMMPNVNQLNPQSRWDFRFKMILDMLKVLQDLGKTRLAIKIKPAGNKERDQQLIQFYTNMISQGGVELPVDVIAGDFQDCLGKTNCVVGTISTAVAEASYKGVPYYIYEPPENGRSDEQINSSELFNRQSIARTPAELRELLLSRKSSVIAERSYLFDGPELFELDLNKLLT